VAEYDIPDQCRYSDEDEWVRADSPEAWVIGVSDYAQQQLGDVVFVELPELGAAIKKGESFGVIESVKAVSDLYAPVSGEVISVNPDLDEAPESVNESCYGAGWIITIRPEDPDEWEQLRDAASYRKYVAEREE